MAKATKTEEVETEAKVTIRPATIAKELNEDPKAVRAFLRKKYPRTEAEENTSWFLTQEQADAVTAHFTREDDEALGEDTDEELGGDIDLDDLED